MTFEPSKEIIKKYANVLVNFALNSGEGIKKGETVLLQVSEIAKPMYVALRNAILQAGGHVISQYLPDDVSREVYDIATDEQLSFFPEKYYKGLLDSINHSIYIISDTDKHELEGIDPKKLMLRGKAARPYMDWRKKKEDEGKFTWTLALYGTEAMAKEARMSLEEYWHEIIKACYLDHPDPVQKWKENFKEIERVKDELNKLPMESLHIKGPDINLIVGVGEDRKWLGGMGRNIPSFELFISPDYRKTEGMVSFNQPLYRYGSLITGISLKFKDGVVVEAHAEQNENLLKEMLNTDTGARRLGEYSLTDSRMSQITRFMGETLFDENMGGRYGNTHMAVGMSYHDSYTGDPSDISEDVWDKMGYNDSAIHTDIISTTNRTVTAHMKDGSTKVIYDDGKFTI